MSANFADLRARTLSALVMAALGAAAVWAGGVIFAAMVAALVGVMVWELARMLDTDAPTARPIMAGITAAVALFVFEYRLAGEALLAALAVSALLLAWPIRGNRALAAGYIGLILFAGLGLTLLRHNLGGIWVMWLVLVVIASDIAGYFAGRLIGGPKLWPRVSPKKTWSGTVAGWICAAGVGLGFMPVLGVGAEFVLLSILVSMAGQAGDIAESAIKRHAGVKDSSNLIPGHGGPMDRFDALIAAALMVLVLQQAGLLAPALAPGG